MNRLRTRLGGDMLMLEDRTVPYTVMEFDIVNEATGATVGGGSIGVEMDYWGNSAEELRTDDYKVSYNQTTLDNMLCGCIVGFGPGATSSVLNGAWVSATKPNDAGGYTEYWFSVNPQLGDESIYGSTRDFDQFGNFLAGSEAELPNLKVQNLKIPQKVQFLLLDFSATGAYDYSVSLTFTQFNNNPPAGTPAQTTLPTVQFGFGAGTSPGNARDLTLATLQLAFQNTGMTATALGQFGIQITDSNGRLLGVKAKADTAPGGLYPVLGFGLINGSKK